MQAQGCPGPFLAAPPREYPEEEQPAGPPDAGLHPVCEKLVEEIQEANHSLSRAEVLRRAEILKAKGDPMTIETALRFLLERERHPAPTPKADPLPDSDLLKHILDSKRNLTREAVERLVAEEVAKAAGLLTPVGALSVVAQSLGVDLAPENPLTPTGESPGWVTAAGDKVATILEIEAVRFFSRECGVDAKLLTAKEDGDDIILRPAKWLGDQWNEVMDYVDSFDGEWIKETDRTGKKVGHWTFPKQPLMDRVRDEQEAADLLEEGRGTITQDTVGRLLDKYAPGWSSELMVTERKTSVDIDPLVAVVSPRNIHGAGEVATLLGGALINVEGKPGFAWSIPVPEAKA